MIEEENCYLGELEFQDGLPMTSNSDRENHGFGLANIRRAIQPYGGEMRWRLDGDEFSLTLLFQLPAASDKAP